MATTGGAKSMEKLSSGYRINRAGDDAAGLAISEKMRGQIRGLNRASANAQDGISLIQTAEGALNETHAILQRMRELAVQSATDTNTETDRGEIQKEINQLTSEINRIGNTTEFNTMKLVDGSRANEYNVTTSQGSKVVNGTGGDVAVNHSAGVTFTGGKDAEWASAIKGGITLKADPAANDAINWKNINTTTADDNEIKLSKDASGNLTIDLKATVGSDKFAHSMTISAATLEAQDGTYKVEFHGVSFDLDLEEFAKADGSVTLDLADALGGTGGAGKDSEGNYKLNSDYALGHAELTGLKVDGTNSALAGIEGLEIELNDAGTEITITGTGSNGADFSQKVTLNTALAVGNEFKYEENGIEFSFKVEQTGVAATNVGFKTNKLDIKGMMASTEDTTIETKELTKDKTLAFQVGANESQSMSLEIGDMRAAALGISSAAGGAGFAADMAITDGTDNTAAEYSLNVTNRDDAASAITTIQSAIDKVSSQRSALGAVQNRLEHTIKNLDTSSENLQASEARIRDVDMAKEMMEQTKQNILSQAATAMLAQANQAPQGVLQLLR